MALTINTNISALKLQRHSADNERVKAKSMEQLSSGLRINHASDDAAGLAIADQLRAISSSSGVAARNISDAVSVASVADGAMESASAITGRMGELAEQAANGTLSASQRSALNNEYTALKSELDRISATTEFNGQQLLSGNSTITIQAGTDGSTSSQVSVNLIGVSSGGLGLTQDLSSQASAQAALDETRAATDSLSSARGSVGSSVTQLETAFNNIKTSELNTREAESRIRDADIAKTAGEFTAAKIRGNIDAALMAQANKQQPNTVLKLLA